MSYQNVKRLKSISFVQNGENSTPSNDAQKDHNERYEWDEVPPGTRIKQFREEAGLTQRQLAALCDPPMNFTAIGQIERSGGAFTGSTIRRLANALNRPLYDFFLPEALIKISYLPEDMRKEIECIADRYYEAQVHKHQP